jgi:hypothetical protein
MDPDSDSDPDPAIFVINYQDANQKIFFSTNFCANYFLKVHLTSFLKIKISHKAVGIKVFLTIFACDRRIRTGSIPLTTG